ncbi:hypothetical protein CRYUN_Cryun23aG0047100 [Craigia yunnanensis]
MQDATVGQNCMSSVRYNPDPVEAREGDLNFGSLFMDARGFDTVHAAARAYDRAAIKFRGVEADINFNISDYEDDIKQMRNFTEEKFVHILRRQSTGFSRGSSKYRGVTLHKCGRWEARMDNFLARSTLIQPLAKAMAKITKGVDMPNMIMNLSAERRRECHFGYDDSEEISALFAHSLTITYMSMVLETDVVAVDIWKAKLGY